MEKIGNKFGTNFMFNLLFLALFMLCIHGTEKFDEEIHIKIGLPKENKINLEETEGTCVVIFYIWKKKNICFVL